MNEIRATLQLVSEGTGCLLQQMQPATVFMIDWATIRATADIRPRPKAGLLGYMHAPGESSESVSTSEACMNQASHYTWASY
jgi:hypothetical protein